MAGQDAADNGASGRRRRVVEGPLHLDRGEAGCEQHGLPVIADRYFAAWNEADVSRRRARIAGTWT